MSKNTRNQAGGGGSDWSSFSATQNVDMDEYDFSNVGGINDSTTATTGYVLTVSLDKSLVWAAAGGGTASAWSTFPATQNVNIAGYSLSGVSNISLQKINGASYPQTLGTPGQVLTISSTANTLYWTTGGGGGGNIADWATCNAIQNVNLSGFSILNISNISTGTLNASTDVYIRGVSVSGSITSLSGTVSNLSGYVYPQISNISSAITSLSGTVSSLSGYVYTISVGTWSTFPATQNVNMSSYVISNISAVFISNNATISGLTTLSTAAIQNALNVSGLVTTSGLTIQNLLTVGGNISGVTEFNGVDVKFGLANTLIAIGEVSASGNTGSALIAIGSNAGVANRGNNTIAFGLNSATSNTSSELIAIGTNAGMNNSGSFSVEIGYDAGVSNTGPNIVAVGRGAGYNNTGNNIVGIGTNAGLSNSGSDSVEIGNNAGFSNTGPNMVAVGNAAGYNNTGNNVVSIGPNAGISNRGNNTIALGLNSATSNTSSDLIAIGTNAGMNNSGSFSVEIGYDAGVSNTGPNIVAVGNAAGYNNTGNNLVGIGTNAGLGNSGSFSVEIGFYAGFSNTGSTIVAVGYGAGYNNTGNNIVGIGKDAGLSNSGSGSVFIGNDAGRRNTGSNVVGVGISAGANNSGSDSIHIGFQTGASGAANNCTFIGRRAGAYANASGSNTVSIGYEAGYSNSGANCILIGQNPSSGARFNASDNQFIVYSSNIYTDFLHGRLDCNFLGINCNTPQYNLDVNGTTNISGNLNISGLTTLYTALVQNNLTVNSNAFISNNATISGLTTLSAAIIRNALNVSGLTTLSSLVVIGDLSSTRTNYKYSNVMYVMSNGNDTTGTGSILNPFATLSKAVSVLESQTLDYDQQGVIYLGPGEFDGNVGFTITKGYLTINGPAMHTNQPQYLTQIGPITINISGQTATYDQNQVILNGLLITGGTGGGNPAITNNSTSQHNLVIKNSLLNGNNRIINQTASNATGTRFIMQDCKIQQDASATSTSSVLLLSGNAWLTLDRCEITTANKGAPIEIGGTTWLRGLANSLIICSLSSSTGTPPLVNLASSTVLLPHTFASNSFFYQATNTKFTQSACAIAFTNTSNLNPGGITPAIIQLYNNIFQLTGTNDTTNYVLKTYNSNNTFPVNSLYVFRANNKVYQATGISYASVIDPSISTSAISNLIGLGPNDPDTGSNWASFPATQNVNMSSYVISNISAVFISNNATISGLTTLSTALVQNNLSVNSNAFISNNATISGLTTLSTALVQNNLSVNQLNGASYPQTLGSTGQVLTISSTANRLYWTTPPGVSFGNVLRVDQVYGNDTLGTPGTYPYMTISKALSVASAGQMVWVMPGTYNEKISIPNNVSIRGANSQGVVIQQLGVTSSTTLVTLGSNSRIEDVTLTLTSSSTPTNAVYKCIEISNGNIPTSKLRTMVINGSNLNPSGSIVGLYTYGDVANPFLVSSADLIRGSSIDILTSGQVGGYANGILVAGNNRVGARDVNIFVTGTSCSGSRIITCETISAGAIDMRASVVSASGSSLTNCSLAEISQTNPSSQILLSYTKLQNHSANGMGFSLAQIPTNIVFGLLETNQITIGEFNEKYYLAPGSILLGSAVTNPTFAAPFVIEQTSILHNVFLSANASLTSGVMTLNLRDGSPTVEPFMTLSLDTARFRTSNNTISRTFQEGGLLYIDLCGGGATGAQSNTRSFQVNVGLF